MAKTLKQFKQGYTPRSADEKKFVDKHTVQKTPDANGNKDDVFNAKNVKAYDRELEHGYNPGSDEDVYEGVELVDEKMNLKTAPMGDVIKDFQKSKAPQFKGKSKEYRRKMAIAAKLQAENVNEAAPALVVGAGLAGLTGYLAKRAAEKTMGADKVQRRVNKEEERALQPVKENKSVTKKAMPVPNDGATADPGVDQKTGRRPIITSGPNKGKEWTQDAPGPTNPQHKPSATQNKVAEAKDVPFEGPYKNKSDAHGPKSRAKHLAKMAMSKAIEQAAQEAASKVSKKKVNESDIKDYLLSLYNEQLSEEDNQVLQEMLETEEGTKIAFMISMLIEDEQMLDEVMKKSEKYSHRSFLNKLKQTNTGA